MFFRNVSIPVEDYTVSQYRELKLKKKLNSVAFSPQANYTDRVTAACRRS
jgi:hypothetical protein